jgi:hypothetical protein
MKAKENKTECKDVSIHRKSLTSTKFTFLSENESQNKPQRGTKDT